MAQTGEEPVISMGFDSPLAILSERPQSLLRTLSQQFAQVTNPPIDAIREKASDRYRIISGTRWRCYKKILAKIAIN